MAPEMLDASRVAVGVLVLAYASVSDLRSRSVPDRTWMFMCTAGAVILLVQMVMDSVPLPGYLIFAPVVILLLDVFDVYPALKRRVGTDLFYPLAPFGLGAALLMLYLMGPDPYVISLLLVPGTFLLGYLFYAFRVLHGGADAKAFISLALLHPLFPAVSIFPLIRPAGAGITAAASLGFPIIVVFYAALLVVTILPAAYLAVNLRRGDVALPHMLFGYLADVDDARTSHVWPMEVVRGGKVVRRLFPGDGVPAQEIDALESAGRSRVWVTPKVPFIVPMTAGYLLAAVIGNPLVLLFQYLLGL